MPKDRKQAIRSLQESASKVRNATFEAALTLNPKDAETASFEFARFMSRFNAVKQLEGNNDA